jgi:hypothetical protein
MQRLLHLALFLFISFNLFAQAPQKMTYQAVIRNVSNNLVVNAPVKMKISILQGSASGTAVYSELHNPTTNANGLVSIEIGSGTSPVGAIGSINWGNGTYFLKTETDPTNGTNYSIVGTSQLLSVPYALQANCVSSSLLGDTLLVGCKKYLIPGIKDLNAPSTINNGLVAYYPFNGNANDESGNNNNGTLFGPAFISDKSGKSNSALNFNGSSNYIKISDNPTLRLTEASFSFWISYTSTEKMEIFQKIDFLTATNANYSAEINDYANLLSGMRVGGTYQGNCTRTSPFSQLTSTFNANDNKWHHLTFIMQANKISLYLDGILKNTLITTGLMNPCSGGDLFIGRGWNDFPLWLNAKLDEFRIYNRALTQEEITYLANN